MGPLCHRAIPRPVSRENPFPGGRWALPSPLAHCLSQLIPSVSALLHLALLTTAHKIWSPTLCCEFHPSPEVAKETWNSGHVASWSSSVALVVKNLPANTGDIRDVGSIPGSGRSPGVWNGKPLQYSCWENLIDRGTPWATVHGVTKSQIWLSVWVHLVDQPGFAEANKRWEADLPGEAADQIQKVGIQTWAEVVGHGGKLLNYPLKRRYKNWDDTSSLEAGEGNTKKAQGGAEEFDTVSKELISGPGT